MELIQISKELELATHMTAQEIRRELAIQLYTQGKLSAGKARNLALKISRLTWKRFNVYN